MSEDHPDLKHGELKQVDLKHIDLKQDRRQWLKGSATILGASLLPMPGSVVSPALAQTQTVGSPPENKSSGSETTATFFTPEQHALVDELAEKIIPADSHSGGAKAAGVVVYIEQVLRGSVDDRRKSDWEEGLRLIDLMSHHYCSKSFVDSSAEEKIAIMTVLADNESVAELPEVRFYRDLKSLTVLGYYTSKIGIHDELDYKGNTLLVEFVGCDDPSPSST